MPSGLGVGGTRERDMATLEAWMAVARRHRRWLVVGPVLAALVVMAVGLILPRTYTVSAMFVPQAGGGAMGRLAGVAAQLGVNLTAPEAAESPEFYAALIRSEQLLGAVVDAPIAVGASRTLADYYNVSSDDVRRRRAKAVRLLREDLSVAPDARTGVLRMEIRLRSGEAGVAVLTRIIEQVNAVNVAARTTQASAERAFVEGRMDVAGSELEAAEQELERFLERNREFQNSARLRFEHDRLRRGVDARQAVFTSLAQNLEQARIDEVRNTPAIAVVAAPELPGLPDSRLLLLKGLASATATVLLLAGGLYARQALRPRLRSPGVSA